MILCIPVLATTLLDFAVVAPASAQVVIVPAEQVSVRPDTGRADRKVKRTRHGIVVDYL